MGLSFDIGFSSETKVSIHVNSGVEIKYHPKKNSREEFVVIECYDDEKKMRAMIFASGDAIDTLIETVGVIGALRFKEQS